MLVLSGGQYRADQDLSVYNVPTGSMEPTYELGDRFVSDGSAYENAKPQVGDVVTLHPPEGAVENSRCGERPERGAVCAAPVNGLEEDTTFFKRVVAGPGDTLSIENGTPVVNGVPAREDFTKPCGTSLSCNYPREVTIPPGHWFLLGDNRGASDDSRFWGPVPLVAITGKVVAEP